MHTRIQCDEGISYQQLKWLRANSSASTDRESRIRSSHVERHSTPGPKYRCSKIETARNALYRLGKDSESG